MISYSITLSLFLSSNTYQKVSFAPLGTMSFARLPHCQIHELFTCLGPDYYHLRASCVMAREKSNGIDLPLEILKWHCTNSDLLDVKLRCVEVLGRIPIRCSCCEVRARTRQMYRYNRSISDGQREGMLYLCSHCALKEVRLFLSGMLGGLLCQGGLGSNEQASLLVDILSRVHVIRGGFIGECLASMRAAR